MVLAPLLPMPTPPAMETPQTVETTIVIIDDHQSFADLLSRALNTVDGMRCLGTASNAAAGVAMAAQLRPNIVIVDIQMPHQDGLLATRRIREVSPDTVIAVVTAHRDPEWVTRAARAGACAFIPKDGSLSEMIEVLQRVRPGQMLVAPSTFRGGSASSQAEPAPAAPALTQRELEVLTYLGQGLQANGIAKILGISLHTCRGYIKSLHSKLGVRTQLEAVIKGQEHRLIAPRDGSDH